MSSKKPRKEDSAQERAVTAARGGRAERPRRPGERAAKPAPRKAAASKPEADAKGTRPGKPGAGPRRAASTSSSARRPAASSSGLARPRIRASHSEGGSDARLSDSDIKKRRARAKASVRSLSSGASARPLPPPPQKRESTGPRSGPAKRRSFPPDGPTPSTASQELALAIAAAGLDKKAVGVEVIDVSGRVDYADFLVIMTGTSDRHVHSIAMGIEEALKRKRMLPLSVEGLGTAAWVLMDFADVVVHVFQEDTRRIYDIEGLWMDASRVNVPEGAAGPT